MTALVLSLGLLLSGTATAEFHASSVLQRSAVNSSICESNEGAAIYGAMKSGPMRSQYPACKYLPFKEFNHSTIRYTIIYRHLPKGGSSTIGTLLINFWDAMWKNEAVRERAIAFKHKIPYVVDCGSAALEMMRRNGAIDFAVARDPLARFISGYYYVSANKLSDGTDGGRKRLIEYSNKLPNIECNGCGQVSHMFPQFFFYCTCGRAFECEKATATLPRYCPHHLKNTLNLGCSRTLRYILKLENISAEWSEFVSMIGACGSEPCPFETLSAKHQASGSLATRGFTGFKVDGPITSDITSPICRFIEGDYIVLKDFYSKPIECTVRSR